MPRGCITGRTRLAAFPRRGASGAQTARPVTGNIRSSRVSSRPGMPIALDSFAEGHFAHAPRAKRAPFGQDPAFQRVLCRGDVLGKRDSVSRQVDELERELRRMHHDHLVPPGPDFRPPLHLEKTPPLETFASRHMPAHPAQEDAADRKSSADSGEARSWRVLQSPDKRSPASVLVCLVPDARNAGSQLSLRPLPTCFQHSEDEAQIQAQEQDVRSTPRQLAEARFRGPFRRKYGSAPGRRCRDDATRTAESWENSNGNRSYEDGSKTKPPPKTAGDSVADITRQWGFCAAENKPESRRSDEHGELALARDSHTENTHVKAALRAPRALSGRRCMVLALWKGMANKTLERHGPTTRLHMERGVFLRARVVSRVCASVR